MDRLRLGRSMNPSHLKRPFFGTLCLSLVLAILAAHAYPAQRPFEPEVGQPGKDAAWVPTPRVVVEQMLDMARITPRDYLIDLGSGDGRTVIAAVKRGARALGIEYNPDLIDLSQRNAAREGVGDKAVFARGDFFESDLSQATVITLFLPPEINLKLRQRLLDLKPGTRIVSNTFAMGEWEADETAAARESCISWCTSLLWIVPAKVVGTWELPQGELELKQAFQMVSGTITSGRNVVPISHGRLRGDQITFGAGGAEYTGRIGRNTMQGTVKSGRNSGKWKATARGK